MQALVMNGKTHNVCGGAVCSFDGCQTVQKKLLSFENGKTGSESIKGVILVQRTVFMVLLFRWVSIAIVKV